MHLVGQRSGCFLKKEQSKFYFITCEQSILRDRMLPIAIGFQTGIPRNILKYQCKSDVLGFLVLEEFESARPSLIWEAGILKIKLD